MQKEKADVKKLIWKIGNGIIIGLLVILFISYLYSPVHTKINKTVEGEYLRYETQETDKVKISINGEIQRAHRFSKEEVAFVGTVMVEFEKYPDRNFVLRDNQLLFSTYENDKSKYYYGFWGTFKEMYHCVDSIYVQVDKNGYHMEMEINEDWENWENYIFAEGERREELLNIKPTAEIKFVIE